MDNIIPEGFFDNTEYLDKYVDYYVNDYQDIITITEDLMEFDTRYNYLYQNFRIVITFERYGTHKTRLITQTTLYRFIEDIKKEINEYNSKYDSDSEAPKVKKFMLKPINPWYGNGDTYKLFKIINDVYYTINFTKTYKNCMAISCLKYLGLIEANTKAKNIKHTLIAHGHRHNINDISYLSSYFKKKIELIDSETLLSKYPSKPDDVILLYAKGFHIGYVTWEIPIVTTNDIKGKITRKQLDIKAIVCYDCEFSFDYVNQYTIKSQDSTLVCAYVLIDNKYYKKKFKNFTIFMAFMQTISKDGIVLAYSHNGGRIEHQFVLKELVLTQGKGNKRGYYEITNIIGTRIKTLKHNNIRFIDSTLFLNKKISELAVIFNTTKTKGHASWHKNIDLDEWYRTKKWDINDKDDVEYCMNDCIILMESLIKFNSIISDKVNCSISNTCLGDWVLHNSSISSIGKQTLLHYHPEIVNNNSQMAVFSPSYKGGRTECFYQGYIRSDNDHKIVVIDINSSYSHQAVTDIAGKYINTVYEIPTSGIWLGIISLKYISNYHIPPLGYLKDYKYVFPNFVNYHTIYLWSFEYEAIKDNLDIDKIHAIYCFETINFSDLMTSWYTLKSNTKSKEEKEVYKILLNGSTGGLGIKQVQDMKILTKDHESYGEKRQLYTYEFYEAFNDYYWLDIHQIIQPIVAYQTISSITAKARLQLWNKMLEISKIGKVLYCDTDSVHALVPKDAYFHNSNILGEWDYNEYQAAYYRGLKMYCLDDKVTFKGIDRDNLKNMSMMHIINDKIISNNRRWFHNKDQTISIKDMECIYTSNNTKREGINADTNPLSM